MSSSSGRKAALIVALIVASPLAAASGDLQGAFRLAWIIPDAGSEAIADTGTRLTVGSTPGFEFDITYMILNIWALECAIAPTRLDLRTTGGNDGGLDAGKVWAVPTTVILQYRIPMYGEWSPYVGAGINYGFLFGYDLSSDLQSLGLRDIKFDPSFGFALQAGIDYDLGNTWYANFDVKYLSWSTEVELRTLGVYDTVKLDIDPWILGLGVGYRF